MNSPKQQAKLSLLLLVLLLLCNGVSNVNCSTVHENSVDLHALLDFQRGITNDPQGALSNWRNTTHFCRWNGVNCTTTRPFRVSSLNLTSQNLQGQISSSVGNLTFLNVLELSSNSFVGTLPLLNHLQKLQYLSVRDNLLHGDFPDALTNCSNLVSLDLSRNHLTGVIPPRIGNLTKLLGLSLFRNNFTGFIPAALGTISTLAKLHLSENQLSGQIPNELWQMSNMVMLALSENSLTGGFPQILPNISSLQLLSLTANMLGGALPSNIGDALPSLQFLYLGLNTFEGHIPASLGNASGLAEIDLPYNYFTGKIPSTFGKLPLSRLNLEKNKLEARDSESWEFFDALANCSDLEVLSLSDNQLEGVIPNSIGNLSINLQRLLMGGNKLSGIVPPNIGNFHNLIQLSLDENNLTGTIEEWVGKLIKLQHLNLHANDFVGTIPASIGNLTQLTSLLLAKNEFEGLIPSSVGLSQLLKLDLSYNNLHGRIPKEAFSITTMITCVLAYNDLEGPIPLEIAKLQQLVELSLSSNRLTGKIPDSMGQCQELEIIQMDQNLLTGNVPVSIGNLKSLSMVNLSHNNLSGTIPVILEDLKFLTQLDLSYNNFKGEVPANGVFQNNTGVSLIGNWGLCGGSSYLHITPCSTVSLRTEVQYYLIRILTPIFGFLSIILFLYLMLLEKKVPRGTYSLLLSFGKQFPKVSYSDLARATKNFSESNLVGRGSYGSVYKGMIVQAKMQVAIKVFDLDMRCADKSFISECEVLRRVRHRNLVSILTACSTVDNVGNAFKAVIYEFMPNGNMDTWLHKRCAGEASKTLDFGQRINILANIADALAYLHHDGEKSIVHCDLKPCNILLDVDLNAYLGDFGIANLIHNSKYTSVGHSSLGSNSDSSIGLKGTIGYIAPEYAQTGQASTCGDVYSFGIVLLEILTGKRPTDSMFDNELNIVNFAERNSPDQILQIIDDHLQQECKGFICPTTEAGNVVYQCLLSLVQVALSCTRMFPRERLTMREVAIKLQAARTSYVKATKREQAMPR